MLKNPLVFIHSASDPCKNLEFSALFKDGASKRFRLDKMHLDAYFLRENSMFLLTPYVETNCFIHENALRYDSGDSLKSTQKLPKNDLKKDA